ncbi:pyruvate formate-lyase-activating protein [Paenibacillus hamazuiensis]|uniref:pyruvate formate-lyase-activating protein n=1 Tax=Paenibacillus hamazuiensis TaxID=2936508 RepID=UPI0020100DAE|nr:pyruvate formate-lyase-activating protein [Paenibacillus hamazuiensis]
MKGRIHSIDTFGTVDGPGIRFVLFMQGCALQCMYCHNPDTWNNDGGKRMSVQEVIAELEPYLEYYRRSRGGITVTGGEPTLQAPFVAELFREVKRRFDLSTALDSSGFCDPGHAAELIQATDLVLLDLKQIHSAEHKMLTGMPNERILRFAQWLSEQGKRMWIRHVLVPGITDSPEHLTALGKYIVTLQGVEKIELLPYHRMGVYKWQHLGKAYPLEGVPVPSDDEVERARAILLAGMQSAKETSGAPDSIVRIR